MKLFDIVDDCLLVHEDNKTFYGLLLNSCVLGTYAKAVELAQQHGGFLPTAEIAKSLLVARKFIATHVQGIFHHAVCPWLEGSKVFRVAHEGLIETRDPQGNNLCLVIKKFDKPSS